MAPEIMFPAIVEGGMDIKVLELSESEERGGGNDINAQDGFEAVVVEIERVLESEKVISVRVHCACVLHDIDVTWRPACSDV